MKHVAAVLSLMFLIVGTVVSQEDTTKWTKNYPRHDIQLGIGDPVLSSLYLSENVFSRIWKYHDPYWDQDWYSDDSYIKYRFITPAITAGYQYRITKWFWVGGFVSYTSSHTQYNNSFTDEKIRKVSEHAISIYPFIRFSWVNTKYVTLYSGLGLGATFVFSNTERGYMTLGGQLTGVGIHVGRYLYGFTEVGVGCKGIISAGIGYKIKPK